MAVERDRGPGEDLVDGLVVEIDRDETGRRYERGGHLESARSGDGTQATVEADLDELDPSIEHDRQVEQRP